MMLSAGATAVIAGAVVSGVREVKFHVLLPLHAQATRSEASADAAPPARKGSGQQGKKDKSGGHCRIVAHQG